MADTKENILLTALRLFAQDGYEAVSVSKIAGELGITKSALYKHYKNKRDIFDHILERVCQLDVARSTQAGVPEKESAELPQPFSNTTVESMQAYLESQFHYWTENEIACDFRRMLTLEQYRNAEMTNLYQKISASGPVDFIKDLIREMMKQGAWREGNPKRMAIELYAPFYLLLSISDATPSKEEKQNIANLFTAHLVSFIEKYAAEK